MQSNYTNIGEEACLLQLKDEGLSREETIKSSEVERVSCECCGISEDCTPTYISRIKDIYYGKWICGLCSEAVQEKKRKYRKFNNEQALEAHMAICKQFNKNTRVNPNLSLADAMINFARKRSQRRDSGAVVARSCGCTWNVGINTRAR